MIKLKKTFVNLFLFWYTKCILKKKEADVMQISVRQGEVSSIDFAKYLNKKALEQDKSPNITKINKWLYICYGLFLAINEKQLLHEKPEAWQYGPFFPDVHKANKKNTLINDVPLLSQYDELIDVVLEKFGDWTAGELVDWTHVDGKAWSVTAHQQDMDNLNILNDFNELFEDSYE